MGLSLSDMADPTHRARVEREVASLAPGAEAGLTRETALDLLAVAARQRERIDVLERQLAELRGDR